MALRWMGLGLRPSGVKIDQNGVAVAKRLLLANQLGHDRPHLEQFLSHEGAVLVMSYLVTHRGFGLPAY
jgi:hypothetical protein